MTMSSHTVIVRSMNRLRWHKHAICPAKKCHLANQELILNWGKMLMHWSIEGF